MCENMYGKLSREQHEQLYKQHVAEGLAISAQNATTYTCPVYASLLSIVATLGQKLVGKRLLCFSYGSGCAASMFSISVQQLPMFPKNVLETLANRTVKSVYDTLQSIEAYEDAFRSFPFEPTNAGCRLAGVYHLERVDVLGVRQYTAQHNGCVVNTQELGGGVVQIQLPQSAVDMVGNLQCAVVHLLVHADNSTARNIRFAEIVDHLQQCHNHFPMVAKYRGNVHGATVLPADITLVNSATNTHGTAFNASAELPMSMWQGQALRLCILEVACLTVKDPLVQPAGVQLNWLSESVAQLKLDVSHHNASQELINTAHMLTRHPDLCAIVLCGEMCSHQTNGNNAMHLSTCLSALVVPSLAALTGRVDGAGSIIALACDWRSCTQFVTFGCDEAGCSEALDTDHLLALGMAHVCTTEASSATSAALEFACSMQQAPPLGLQHCLQLMRSRTNIDSGLQACQTDCPAGYIAGALRLSQDQRTRFVCQYKQMEELTLAQSLGSLHTDPGHGLLQCQLGSTYHTDWITSPIEFVEIVTFGRSFSHGQLVHPTLCSQLGAVDDRLVTLSFEDEFAVLELNDARHYNAVSLDSSHDLTMNVPAHKNDTDICLCRRTCQ